jgi:hypothetical protein
MRDWGNCTGQCPTARSATVLVPFDNSKRARPRRQSAAQGRLEELSETNSRTKAACICFAYSSVKRKNWVTLRKNLPYYMPISTCASRFAPNSTEIWFGTVKLALTSALSRCARPQRGKVFQLRSAIWQCLVQHCARSDKSLVMVRANSIYPVTVGMAIG